MLLQSSGTKEIVGIDRAGDSHNITVGAALRNWNSTWYLCSVLGKSEFISGSCEIRVHQINSIITRNVFAKGEHYMVYSTFFTFTPPASHFHLFACDMTCSLCQSISYAITTLTGST